MGPKEASTFYKLYIALEQAVFRFLQISSGVGSRPDPWLTATLRFPILCARRVVGQSLLLADEQVLRNVKGSSKCSRRRDGCLWKYRSRTVDKMLWRIARRNFVTFYIVSRPGSGTWGMAWPVSTSRPAGNRQAAQRHPHCVFGTYSALKPGTMPYKALVAWCRIAGDARLVVSVRRLLLSSVV